jgi:4-amino-4-deoxychorismate lyase
VTKRSVVVIGIGAVDPDAGVVPADDLGLTRGDGCFEATRVVTDDNGNIRVDHLPEHLVRLQASSVALGLPDVVTGTWQSAITELLADSDHTGEAILKLMITRGRESSPTCPPAGIVTLTPMSPTTLSQRRNGISALTLNRGTASDAFADAPWLLGGVKTLSYGMNMAAQRFATAQGADDVIFVSTDGYVLEGPTSAVVWLSGGGLTTTPVGATGILASITQRALFEAADRIGIRTGYRLGTVAELRSADGVWLVSSGRGVARVHTMNGTPIADPNGWTARLAGLAGF